MHNRRFYREFGIALLFLTACGPPSANAGDSRDGALRGSIELGAGYTSDDSAKFGEYNGLADGGYYPLLGFTLGSASDWESDVAGEWSISGRRLGLESRSLAMEFERFGQQELTLDYTEIPKLRSDGGRTVFTNPEAIVLTLPSGWVPDTTTAGMTALNGSLQAVDEESKRRRLELNYRLQVNTDWTLHWRAMHESKQGLRTQYGVIGNTGGNPRSTALPVAIDFNTDELGFSASYVADGHVVQAGYELSLFDNGNRQTVWSNPFSAIAGWNAAAGYPSGQGALSGEPDNRYQRLYANGHVRLTPRSSVDAELSFARMEQDEHFLPYSINPSLSVTTPLPRESLDGQIDIGRAGLSWQGSFGRGLSLRAGLRYEDRDNKTPRAQYIYIGGDSQDQDTASSDRARTNLPYSYTERSAYLGTNLRLRRGGVLGLRLDSRHIERDYTEVDNTDEGKLYLSWRKQLAETLNISTKIGGERREPDDYNGDEPFRNTYSSAYIATLPADERFENNPLLRKYYLAERERKSASLGLNWSPSAMLNIGLNVVGRNDDYEKSPLGLQQSQSGSVNLDVAVMPGERSTINLFLSGERYDTRLRGRAFRGGAVLVAQSQDIDRNWYADTDDRVRTAGLSFDFREIVANTDLHLESLVARGDSATDVTANSALTTLPLPDEKNTLRRYAASIEHRWSTRLQIELGVLHERFEQDDFRLDGVEAATMANVIAFGDDSADESINHIYLSLRYRL